jgi:hypothetical protein
MLCVSGLFLSCANSLRPSPARRTTSSSRAPACGCDALVFLDISCLIGAFQMTDTINASAVKKSQEGASNAGSGAKW